MRWVGSERLAESSLSSEAERSFSTHCLSSPSAGTSSLNQTSEFLLDSGASLTVFSHMLNDDGQESTGFIGERGKYAGSEFG